MSVHDQLLPRDVFAIGVAARTFDVRSMWHAEECGPSGWEYQLGRSKQLADEFGAVARDALHCAGVSTPAAADCTIASLCGFAHLAEWIHRRLSARGPAWVDPEAFVYCQPHVVTSLVCMRLGLSGSALTMIGPDAGRQALAHGVRSLALQRRSVQIVGAYEVVSPASALRLTALGVRADPDIARAAFAVLASAGYGSDRGVRVGSASDRCAPAAGARAQPSRPLAPLLALVHAYRRNVPALTLAALGGGLR
jgi:hypothetical protein